MIEALSWLFTVEIVGLGIFPLCFFLFPRLKDRGFFITKTIGILAIAYLSWILSVLHILPSVKVVLWGLVVLLSGTSWFYGWRIKDEISAFFAREKRVLLLGEGIFLLVFVAWVLYRVFDSGISHTEQPMDFAFLNSAVRTKVGHPIDPWFSGHTISYYYFGYWLMATLTKLTSINSAVSYNLALALIPALGAQGVFGLVFNVCSSSSKSARNAAAAGIVSVVLLITAANAQGTLEFMRANEMGSTTFWEWVDIEGMTEELPSLSESWRPAEFLWWWRASRVIRSTQDGEVTDYTIHEFPFFSFILGDLHPHVMSIPFVLLFLTMCWNLFKSPQHVWRIRDIRQTGATVLLAVSLGTLGFINMWDLPIFTGILFGVLLLKACVKTRIRPLDLVKEVVVLGTLIFGLAILAITPYLVGFTSQVSGISVNGPTSRPIHMLIVWAIPLVAVLPVSIGAFSQTVIRTDWARLAIISLVGSFMPFIIWAIASLWGGVQTDIVWARLILVLPWVLVTTITVYSMLWLVRSHRSQLGKVFSLLLIVSGMFLIMAPELFYVDDSFDGPWRRMNTVFKFYYQSWIILSIAGGFGFFYWVSNIQSRRNKNKGLLLSWAAVFILTITLSGYYTVASAVTKTNSFNGIKTLDGLAFIQYDKGSEYRGIRYISRHADDDSVLLEAVGDDYGEYSRISAYTGVPTILGWPGHELQWRGIPRALARRKDDVKLIYTTQDIERAERLLSRYKVDYVFVGHRERTKYGNEAMEKFNEFMEEVFRDGEVVIYQMPSAALFTK